MDLIEQLEKLRPVIGIYYADDKEYGEDLGKEEMLDNCLEIVWKWLLDNNALDKVEYLRKRVYFNT